MSGGDQVVDQRIDGGAALEPTAGHSREGGALADPALLADRAIEPRELGREVLGHGDDVVEGVGDPAGHPRPARRESCREVPPSEGL
jgi:hypothetical protein